MEFPHSANLSYTFDHLRSHIKEHPPPVIQQMDSPNTFGHLWTLIKNTPHIQLIDSPDTFDNLWTLIKDTPPHSANGLTRHIWQSLDPH